MTTTQHDTDSATEWGRGHFPAIDTTPPKKTVCRHCGAKITHQYGARWDRELTISDLGGMVFPEYCPDGTKHEPQS